MEKPVIPQSIAEKIQAVHDEADRKIASIMAGIGGDDALESAVSPEHEVLAGALSLLDDRWNLRTADKVLRETGFDTTTQLYEFMSKQGYPIVIRTRRSDRAKLVGLASRN